jgi:two-component system, cell cycle sensor histidine kinase and response regulator CckA
MSALQALGVPVDRFARLGEGIVALLRYRHKRRPSDCPPPEKIPPYSVLVLDDEEIIRNLAQAMIECLGYRVTTCATGEEAIELYARARASGTPYLTAIMDLTIHGGMGGKDAAAQILLAYPDARLVVSSGYSDDPVMANHTRYGFHSILPKPYRLADMANVLTAVALSEADLKAPLASHHLTGTSG